MRQPLVRAEFSSYYNPCACSVKSNFLIESSYLGYKFAKKSCCHFFKIFFVYFTDQIKITS